MLVHIPNVLAPATLADVRTLMEGLTFAEGSATAGWHARSGKTNRQAAPSPVLERIQEIVMTALASNDVVRAMVLPHRIVPPLVSLSGTGQGYGVHVDDAFVGGASRVRSDVSVTVFLNDPEDYDGGELVVETLGGADEAKLPAGDAVIYSSTTLHRVAPVTRGERRVAVTWIESRVRDPACRELLFDLDRARRAIFETEGKSATFDLVTKSYSNLLRRWAEG